MAACMSHMLDIRQPETCAKVAALLKGTFCARINSLIEYFSPVPSVTHQGRPLCVF